MSAQYKATIGLEIHAELKTRTKMFCDSVNDPEEKTPNVNICPVCMAHPGTLPVINKEAVKHVLKVGLAVGGMLADFTEFDRKNYFYPDIPKGYQISQYKYPLISGGTLNNVKLTRVHLEEDTARSSHLPAPQSSPARAHLAGGRQAGDKNGYSLVDFNRAGIPLMELVTEPVVKSAEEASAFARELQLLLRTLGASDANMEKGEMRVEANISIAPIDAEPRSVLEEERSDGKGQFSAKLGTKVEIKNLNSFRTVERAIAHEIDRQSKLLERGEKVIQETRGWDEAKQVTFSQRLKEESHDYRYFPDPDLPKLKISEIKELSEANLRKEMPELPWDKRARLVQTYGVKKENAEIFVQNEQLGVFFETVVKEVGDKKGLVPLESKQLKTKNHEKNLSQNARDSLTGSALAENYITSDLVGLIKNNLQLGGSTAKLQEPDMGNITPENFSRLIRMLLENKISSRGAKEILSVMYQEGGSPETIAESHGLLQKSDEGELTGIVKRILDENKNIVAEYKQGETASLQFLIGQVMKASKGSANPQLVREILLKSLM